MAISPSYSEWHAAARLVAHSCVGKLATRELLPTPLAQTWALIQRFEIQQYGTGAGGENGGHDELLDWVNEAIDKSGISDFDGVTNWTSDFADGRAFCAVLVAQNMLDKSQVRDPSKVSGAKAVADAQANLKLAFDTAEKVWAHLLSA